MYPIAVPSNLRRDRHRTSDRTDKTRVDRRTRAARAEGRKARDELLTAALRVFARRGYREAGVDEIAAEAGYSKGALYWHFSGKEALLTALLEERIDAPMRDNVALLASAPPERDMSVEATRAFAEQLGEQREAVLLEREYWSLAIRDPELRARYVQRQAELRRALARALEARARHLGTPEVPMPAEAAPPAGAPVRPAGPAPRASTAARAPRAPRAARLATSSPSRWRRGPGTSERPTSRWPPRTWPASSWPSSAGSPSTS